MGQIVSKNEIIEIVRNGQAENKTFAATKSLADF